MGFSFRRLWLLLVFVVALRPGVVAQTTDDPVGSTLELTSSNRDLQAAFDWAKRQALAYAHEGKNAAGPWYEASLPNRSAYCMRDVSHQVLGAEFLGLRAANENMLGRFARAISLQRDWAGYWEIDKDGNPSKADYIADDNFWYNLPANFDVMDAMIRRARWTGRREFTAEETTFFERTVGEYTTSWQLEPERILSRPRLMNRRADAGRFVNSRGIPGYEEQVRGFNVGVDLIAAELRGLESLAEAEPSRSSELRGRAKMLQEIIDHKAWLADGHHFGGAFFGPDRVEGEADTYVLHFGASGDSEHIRGALDHVTAPEYWQRAAIEVESYLPALFYRYGRAEAGFDVIRDMARPGKKRQEYPEASFGVLEALIEGTMGIEAGPLHADYDLRTLPQLPEATTSVSIRNLPFRGGSVSIDQSGVHRVRLVNNTGAPIRWRVAMRQAKRFRLGKRALAIRRSTMPGGEDVSWVVVEVRPAAAVTVEID